MNNKKSNENKLLFSVRLTDLEGTKNTGNVSVYLLLGISKEIKTETNRNLFPMYLHIKYIGKNTWN